MLLSSTETGCVGDAAIRRLTRARLTRKQTPQISAYLRLIRVPQGPTLTFRVLDYSLMGDLARQQQRNQPLRTDFRSPPLVVMNNFAANNHFKLVATMFKGLFPAINVHTTKLKDCRRVLLLNYDAERDVVEWRHYRIIVRPVGITRAVKVLCSFCPPLTLFSCVSISFFCSP